MPRQLITLQKDSVMAQAIQPKQVTTVSAFFLISVWIVAIASIPSASSFREQLDAGKANKDIVTLSDSVSIITLIASIGAWLVTSRWLAQRYDQQVSISPGSIRLSRPWAFWSWIVPVVSLWFPKMIIDDLLKAKENDSGQIITKHKTKSVLSETRTWWFCFVLYSLMSNLKTVWVLLPTAGEVPIHPEFELASACILTASYTIWVRIVNRIG